jgi:hypothetical protein
MRRFAMPLVLVLLALALFVWGAKRQDMLVNTDMRSDQEAYIYDAKAMAQTNFQYIGGRNRMPVYPSLMSFFYTEGIPNEDFFRRGKTIGILIALVVSSVVLILFRQVSSLLDASVATLVAMFTVFAYKAPYFQTEVLFYGINLTLFYLLLSLLKKPGIQIAALAGITAGIGHLTKASVLPALFLAGLCLFLRGVMCFKCRYNVANLDSPPSAKARHLLAHMCYVIVLLGCFLVLVFPYIRTSKERFGQYFYNVNSTFYIWYDSWEEVEQGTKAHGDRRGWPDMPEDQIPSFKKYVREHSLRSIAGRFARGLIRLTSVVIRSYGYAEFLAAYVIAAALFFGQNFGWTRSVLSRTNPCVLLFIVGYFLGYILLYAWYADIAAGNRFVLSLFLPALLIILSLFSRVQSDKLSFVCFGRKIPAFVTSWFVLFFLFAYLMIVFPHRVSTMYGGV